MKHREVRLLVSYVSGIACVVLIAAWVRGESFAQFQSLTYAMFVLLTAALAIAPVAIGRVHYSLSALLVVMTLVAVGLGVVIYLAR
jgi:hypothetical protein